MRTGEKVLCLRSGVLISLAGSVAFIIFIETLFIYLLGLCQNQCTALRVSSVQSNLRAVDMEEVSKTTSPSQGMRHHNVYCVSWQFLHETYLMPSHGFGIKFQGK